MSIHLRRFLRLFQTALLLLLGALDLAATLFFRDTPLILIDFFSKNWASYLCIPALLLCLDAYKADLIKNPLFLLTFTCIQCMVHVEASVYLFKGRTSLSTLCHRILFVAFSLCVLRTPQVITVDGIIRGLLALEYMIVFTGSLIKLDFPNDTDRFSYIEITGDLELNNYPGMTATPVTLYEDLRTIGQTTFYLFSSSFTVLYYLLLFCMQFHRPYPGPSVEDELMLACSCRMIQFNIFFKDLMVSKAHFRLWQEPSKTLLCSMFKTLNWYPFITIPQAHALRQHAAFETGITNTVQAETIVYHISGRTQSEIHHVSIALSAEDGNTNIPIAIPDSLHVDFSS